MSSGPGSPAIVPVDFDRGRRAAVRVRQLRRAFGNQLVLSNLELTIAEGEFVALLGASGSGKSTLLRTLAGLDPVDGEVDVPDARAVVFQEPRLLPWKRVWRNVAVGLPRKSARREAAAALDEVGLGPKADAWPTTLSGGEAQRTALARALVREPRLLLLDEPFASLDALTRIKMHALVDDLWRRHSPAVLLVTHDVDEALLLADRVLVLDGGHIAYERTVELDRPRRRARAAFDELRSWLLTQLGVAEFEPSHDPARPDEEDVAEPSARHPSHGPTLARARARAPQSGDAQ